MNDKAKEWRELYKKGKMSREELEDLLKGEKNLEEIKKLIDDND